MVFDPQLLVEVSKCIVVKLFAIVRDKDSRDTEAPDDAFPNEASNILLRNGGLGFWLDPLSEVVDPHDEELKLSCCRGEGSHYVKPSLSERLRSTHWGQLFQRLSYDIAKSLAFVACFYIGLDILLHRGPIIPHSYELVN